LANVGRGCTAECPLGSDNDLTWRISMGKAKKKKD
jgi:hypothetical protein